MKRWAIILVVLALASLRSITGINFAETHHAAAIDYNNTAFRIKIDLINITFSNPLFQNITTDFLSERFNLTRDDCIGCNSTSVKTINFTRRYFHDNYLNTSEVYFILFMFDQDVNGWYLSAMVHRNMSENVLFTYKTGSCRPKVSSGFHLGFHCTESVTCEGEETGGNKSTLVMDEVSLQVFTTERKKYSQCNESGPGNFPVALTVGVVVGVTVIAAALVILSTLAIRRIRFGRYNLLKD